MSGILNLNLLKWSKMNIWDLVWEMKETYIIYSIADMIDSLCTLSIKKDNKYI